MKAFLKKISSRKFLTCVAGVVMGVCMVFGLDEGAVNTIAGAITSIASVCIYIYSEGKIDAVAVDKVKDAVDDVNAAIDVVVDIEE